MKLRTTVNSFDLFDTLVARRAFYPQRIFEDIERALGAKGYSAARIEIEKSLAQRGSSFDIHDIYRELVFRQQCSNETAEVLKAAEIDAEFDHAVPIVGNLARVREFDLVISDMYLPADILRRLLQHVGLRVFVHLFVSNSGKHFGTIWPKLSEQWLIQRHLGDNTHADVASPQHFGIAAEHFADAQASQVEHLLVQHGQIELAGLVRSLRLRNPYPEGSTEATLWLLYAQLNFPLLCLYSSAIRQHQSRSGYDRILFSARDGHFLSELFSILYPSVRTDYLHVSRHVLWRHRQELTNLLMQLGGANPLVVDLVSTGHSWYSFSEATAHPINFSSLVHIDHHQPVLTTLEQLATSRYLRFSTLLRNSELAAYSNAIEVLNTAPHGSTRGLVTCNQWTIPQLAGEHELPRNCLDALTAVHATASDMLRKGRARVLEEFSPEVPRGLLTTLVQTICTQTLLNDLGRKFV